MKRSLVFNLTYYTFKPQSTRNPEILWLLKWSKVKNDLIFVLKARTENRMLFHVISGRFCFRWFVCWPSLSGITETNRLILVADGTTKNTLHSGGDPGWCFTLYNSEMEHFHEYLWEEYLDFLDLLWFQSRLVDNRRAGEQPRSNVPVCFNDVVDFEVRKS